MPVSRRAEPPKVKPLLVGESNPYGGDPYYALYPAPDGCAGHRLCCLILGMRRKDYLEHFDRTNLCEGPWSMREARRRAEETSVPVGRVKILLGSKVAKAHGLPFLPFTYSPLAAYVVLPHPSGLCRLWNEPGAFERARKLVAEACPDINHLFGACTGAEGDE